MADQRYVPSELIHFVGRHLTNDDERFKQLETILHSGVLRACWVPPGTPGQVRTDELRNSPDIFLMKPNDTREGPVGGDSHGKLVAGTLLAGTGLCFCDIPVADLSLHMSRYTPFGISFRKRFLAERGATPVFYVAMNANVGDPSKNEVKLLGDVFNEMGEAFFALQKHLSERSDFRADPFLKKLRWDLADLFKRVFCYIKGFDALSNGDENVYMEREWRMMRNVRFKLHDVWRVVLPEEFAPRFRKAFPNFTRQLTFAESIQEP